MRCKRCTDVMKLDAKKSTKHSNYYYCSTCDLWRAEDLSSLCPSYDVDFGNVASVPISYKAVQSEGVPKPVHILRPAKVVEYRQITLTCSDGQNCTSAEKSTMTKLIEEGWQPYGYPAFHPEVNMWFQMIVKYKENE